MSNSVAPRNPPKIGFLSLGHILEDSLTIFLDSKRNPHLVHPTRKERWFLHSSQAPISSVWPPPIWSLKSLIWGGVYKRCFLHRRKPSLKQSNDNVVLNLDRPPCLIDLDLPARPPAPVDLLQPHFVYFYSSFPLSLSLSLSSVMVLRSTVLGPCLLPLSVSLPFCWSLSLSLFQFFITPQNPPNTQIQTTITSSIHLSHSQSYFLFFTIFSPS